MPAHDRAAPGPFAAALRAAIQASGLTLESLRHRLGERGIRVSTATLSYWQGGRSRPERAGSIEAVGVLEDVLGLPGGALTELLRPRPPRVQTCGGTTSPVLLWADPGPVVRTLGQLDRSGDHRLEWLSVHDVYAVDADRRPMSLSVRLVLRALGDDVDRVLAVHCANATTEPPPVLGDLRYCRRGRVRHDGAFVAFELFFDRILARGDTAVVEYELNFPGERLATQFYDRRFRHPAREYLCIIRFARNALPARCRGYEFETINRAPLHTAELWIGTSRSTHVTKRNVETGILRTEWEWE